METIGLLKDGRSIVILNKNEVAFLDLAGSLDVKSDESYKGSKNKSTRRRKSSGRSKIKKVPQYLRRRKKLVHNGVEFTRNEAAKYLGIGIPTLNGRIYRGWSDEALFESAQG